MKKYLLPLLILFCASIAQGQGTTGQPAARLRPSTFANLGAPADGSVRYCTNCAPNTTPCTGSSTGAFATRVNGAWSCSTTSASGAGDVAGPASATDNAAVRFNLTTGKIIQNSGVIIDDSNNVSGFPSLTSTSANPADAGVLRLGNAECVAWEKFVAGTDWTLCLNASDELETNANMRALSFIGPLTGNVTGNVSGSSGSTTGNAATVTTNANSTGDVTSVGNATTLATVNGNVGTFGSATESSQVTVNAKGLVTAAANVTVTPAVGSITGLGTNVATALAVAIGSAGAPVLFNGVGGTPSSLTGTNISGTAAGLTAGNVTTNANLTGHVTSTGNAALLGSFTVAQLNTAISDADVATGGGTASGTNTGDQTSVSGNAGTVTVADAGGDTTTFPLLGTAATGSLAPATDAGLTYNATTDALTATTFVGALTGHASLDAALASLNTFTGVTQTFSADNPILKLADITLATPTPLFIGNLSGFGGLSINLNYATGVFGDTAKAGAEIDLISANADSSITFATSDANNTSPTTRMTIGKAGAITWTSGVTDASGTPGSLCYNTSTFVMLKNNALTCTVSGREFKSGIAPVRKGGLDTLLRMQPRQFTYNDNPARLRWGFVADELQAIDSKLADGYDTKGQAKSIDIPGLLAINTKSIQELHAIVAGHTEDSAIKRLDARLTALEKRTSALERENRRLRRALRRR